MPPPPSPPPGWDRGGPGPTGPWATPGDRPPVGYQPFGTASPWGAASRDHPNGTTVLVLGILGLVACGLLGPVAWIMGNKAIREIDADPGVIYRNRGNVNAGRVCGIIATAFLALGVLGVVVIIVAATAGQG
jgi:hypothetical protein